MYPAAEKEYSMNYKCSFPSEWLGLEGEELVQATGFESASFCHKGGFLMTMGALEDALEVCRISLRKFSEEPVIVSFGGNSEIDSLLHKLPHMKTARILPSGISEPSRSRNGWHLWGSGHGQIRMESKHKRPGQKNL